MNSRFGKVLIQMWNDTRDMVRGMTAVVTEVSHREWLQAIAAMAFTIAVIATSLVVRDYTGIPPIAQLVVIALVWWVFATYMSIKPGDSE